MSDIENKITEMRNGFAAVSEAVEAIANQPAPKPQILDRQLSGNKINNCSNSFFNSSLVFSIAQVCAIFSDIVYLFIVVVLIVIIKYI